MKILTSLLAFLAGTLSLAAQTNWALDKNHSDIRFTVTHMTIAEVDGEFKEFDGKVVSRSDDFDGGEIEFVAQVGSINTDNERRDGHLKSDDFFNAEAYPELKFKGNLKKERDNYFLVGDLTIRDVTKQVRFPVKYMGQISGERGKKAGFKVSGVIDRFDYGLKWNNALETGGLVVGKDVQITCNIELNEVQNQ